MKPTISKFQFALLGGFIVLFVLGFLAFSGRLPLPQGKNKVNYGAVTVWGTLPGSVVQRVLGEQLQGNDSINITYIEKSPATFQSEFVNALAVGGGPDLIIVSQENLLQNLDKLIPIPYETASDRTFRDTFVQGAELFLAPEGVLALPVTIDPLVMYYNRDILTNAGIVQVPRSWSQFYALTPRLTVRDRFGNVTQSFVSFGEYANVTNAKGIISMLMLQAGRSIVTRAPAGLVIDLASEGEQSPAVQAITFYTEFANPSKEAYTWNRSFSSSRATFEAGELVLYFGLASEYASIAARSPHLNFDVAVVPQPEQITRRTTYGNINASAITRSTRNPAGALQTALLLTTPEIGGALARELNLPPVRRDLLLNPPTDSASRAVFYDSALIVSTWLDPLPSQTNTLFLEMINDINSGRLRISEALRVVNNGLANTLSSYQR